jgi:hypothetical protein
MDNLENFNKAFFSEEPDNQEPVQEDEELEEIEEESDENEEDDDSLATDDEDELEDEDEDEEPQPKAKKRNRTQERIEKLVAEARQAERDRDALRRQLDEVLASTKKEEKTEAEPALKDKLVPEAPQPDAVDKDGEPLYPLGEFDPKYVADLTRFTITQEMEAAQKRQEALLQQKEIETQQEALKASWEENLERAEETVPDIREHIATMADAFEGIDPNYGEYLAGTIMSCEYGPEIMYYLSQNIGEAQKIVASGPAAATLAIGRLEAKFMTKPEDAKRNKRVSDAPPPPNARSRGSGGRFSVPPDTRDLAAFRREFYKE